jgi:oxygen-independent coproporphyrinogen-3 oxidase
MHIVAEQTSSSTLAGLIESQVHGDYVYMYPPRQAYRPFTDDVRRLPELISGSLARFDDLNLYVHVPFCRQICSFCNLYAVSGNGRELDGYVDAVVAEAERYAGDTDRKTVRTLYLGGGTPSILTAAQLGRLVTSLLGLFATRPDDIPPETALEVDPATVDARKLRDIRAAGINRINLGYQSMVRDEVVGIGRDRPFEAGLDLLGQALDVGFDNVCVDLIYGLEGQTDENWRRSVSQVAAIGPPTVCAYALTLRPFTGYSRRGYAATGARTTCAGFATAAAMCRRSTTGRCATSSGSARARAATCGTWTFATDTRSDPAHDHFVIISGGSAWAVHRSPTDM